MEGGQAVIDTPAWRGAIQAVTARRPSRQSLLWRPAKGWLRIAGRWQGRLPRQVRWWDGRGGACRLVLVGRGGACRLRYSIACPHSQLMRSWSPPSPSLPPSQPADEVMVPPLSTPPTLTASCHDRPPSPPTCPPPFLQPAEVMVGPPLPPCDPRPPYSQLSW